MGKYEKLAKKIVTGIGGKENVHSLTNCITRLRFKLKSEDKANTEVLKKLDGVVAVKQAGGQYQVVIGNHVPEVKKDVDIALGILASPTDTIPKGNLFDQFVDMISSIFQPILAPLSAAGMLKGVMAILTFVLGANFADSPTALVFDAMGDGLFQFLPIFIGFTAMKKFGGSPFLGMLIASSMVYPGFSDGSVAKQFTESGGLDFFSIPFSIPPAGYASTVIPVIAAIAFAAFFEKQFRKVIPDVMKLFIVPFLTALITIPLTFIVIGPVMDVVSGLLGNSLLFIQAFNPILFGAVLGFSWQVLVMFGLHWAIIPFAIIALSQGEPTSLLTPICSVSFAQTGAVLAVMMKTKNRNLRELSIPAFISGLFGVTEPAIYGITLPKKRPFWVSCFMGGITGAIAMGIGMEVYQMGGLGIFHYIKSVSPDGNFKFVVYCLILDIVAIVGSFVLAYAIGFKDDEPTILLSKEETTLIATGKDRRMTGGKVFSPIKGHVFPLSEAKDGAFAEGILGKGVVVEPTEGEIVSPFDGTVMSLFPTHHAIGLVSEDGAEVLIHIGIDTVQLNGKGFKAFVKQGDIVEKGQKLVEFDIDEIENCGYSTQVPIIVTNTPDFADVLPTSKVVVTDTDLLMTTVLAN